MYSSRNNEPDTPSFRPKNRGKSLLGKRLYRKLGSGETEATVSSTCETSAESSWVKNPPHKSAKADIAADLQGTGPEELLETFGDQKVLSEQ